MTYWVFCEGEKLDAAIRDFANSHRSDANPEEANLHAEIIREWLYSRPVREHGLRRCDEDKP